MTRIPDLLVEKVHLGEATEAERAMVLADADARARLEALPSLDAAFLEALPPDEEIRRIEGRARTSAARSASNRPAVASALLAPLLAAAMALLWVALPPSERLGTDGVEVTTPKGLPAKLRVYRQRADRVERIPAGTVARKGDRIQLGIVRGDAAHGAVVSVDGRGTVTLHFPEAETGSTALGSGESRLPDAYELDDAPEYERFFLISARDEPIDVGTVLHAAEALAEGTDAKNSELALPRSYDQSSFLLRKEER